MLINFKDNISAFIMAIALSLSASLGFAGSLESVLMPGKVISGHAKLEDNCRNCHVVTDRSAQDKLCKDCHKEVGKDFDAGAGYHGHMRESKPCRTCHTEHKGRNAKVVHLDEKTFDHNLTDFQLRGKHTNTECSKCHQAGKKFRNAQSTCIACHKKDDKHKGSLGTTCAECHTEKDWKEAKFDHDKTRFKLLGKHENVECTKCHANQKFKNTPMACIGCHKKDDTHKGRFGIKCDSCHNAHDWKKPTFSHDTDTKYPLRGKHNDLKCNDCHKGLLYKDKLQTACIACHKKDDKHKESLGIKCADCHVERSWKEARFDHSTSKFPLKGKHIDTKCDACHKSPVFKDTPLDCNACHKKDDKHKGSLGEHCEECHAEKSWKETSFNHSKTRFPLFGKHQSVKCEDCHKDNKYKGTPETCIACHKKDDKHNGQEGEKCENCHNADDWKKTSFNHARARFPLTGKHIVVECGKCHLSAQYKDAKMECNACHDKDDVHKKKLGPQCETCHNTRDWKLWDFNHDKRTNFKLDGGHLNLACDACHKRPVTDKTSLPSDCYSCHEKNDVHGGSFGHYCEKCHVTSSFKKIRLNAGFNNQPDNVSPLTTHPPQRS